jgi:hypothetical protein
MRTSTVLAICWTTLLVAAIYHAANGSTPSWWAVFMPLGMVVLDKWSDVAVDILIDMSKENNEENK